AVPLYIQVFREINLSFRTYIAFLRPALTGSFIMIISVLIVKTFLSLPSAYLRLLIETATGAVTYSLAIAGLYFGELRRAYTMIRPATQRLALAPEGTNV
ncbi:MAG: hypothetical protein JO249_20140, partial [Acidobacteria bacterium]|nr:hypothetical protein [Acidobacteriota bacterium]